MTVDIVREPTSELIEALTRLLPQLSRSAPALDEEDVARMLRQDALTLLAFRGAADSERAGEILGLLSLITFRIPTGVRAWIEDVVVDEAARGQGAGQALVEAAVAHAHELGARSVDLTSRPSREAANRLYRRAGFATRETNIYRYTHA